jgi:hypothetical protein
MEPVRDERLSPAGAQQACLACGTPFTCGMGNADPCWCSVEFPAVMALPEGARGCYCRHCLAGLIEKARAENPGR